MDFVTVTTDANVATVSLRRGKVNALNDRVVAELRSCFRDLSIDPAVKTVILTGTPQGVGFARKPPVFLKHGDKMVIEVEKIGRLENPVVAEGAK